MKTLLAIILVVGLAGCAHQSSVTSSSSSQRVLSMNGVGGTNAYYTGTRSEASVNAEPQAKVEPKPAPVVASTDTDKIQDEMKKLGETTKSDDGKLHVSLKSEILFDSGSAKLKPAAMNDLRQVASVLKQFPNRKVNVEGHTDNQGNASKNRKLSKQRAEVVRKALIENGLTSDRVSASGRGAEKPVAGNESVDGRAKNRRVELHIDNG